MEDRSREEGQENSCIMMLIPAIRRQPVMDLLGSRPACVPGEAQHLKGVHARLRGLWWCAADTDLGFTGDRRFKSAQVGQARLAWTFTDCNGPGSAAHRYTLR